ncbi:hypothetical protein QEV83_13825 [Methylocapsa sp. D3K7]|uniref:hypothetical protein n=1 Tax=Methylocapsa sp. D3K7 TaxID=3041435 RepID=UPI00244ED215|nr:hypothetical protein [Methylocapsa sp. D3K7]WGJ13754.1 hypothetical protein QEV83_13825 [Methylocapsa sp. D3K7]
MTTKLKTRKVPAKPSAGEDAFRELLTKAAPPGISGREFLGRVVEVIEQDIAKKRHGKITVAHTFETLSQVLWLLRKLRRNT